MRIGVIVTRWAHDPKTEEHCLYPHDPLFTYFFFHAIKEGPICWYDGLSCKLNS